MPHVPRLHAVAQCALCLRVYPKVRAKGADVDVCRQCGDDLGALERAAVEAAMLTADLATEAA